VFVGAQLLDRPQRGSGKLTSTPTFPTLPTLGATGTREALDQIRRGAANSAPLPAGRYDCLHRTSYRPKPTTGRSPADQEERTDIWLYVDDTHRGVRITTKDTPHGTPDREDLLPGDFTPSIEHPADDAYTLAQQLKPEFLEQQGPAAWMLSVATMFEEHAVSPQQRAAAASALGGADGVTYRNRGVDRVDRHGLEFVADNADHTRQGRLLFDPTDGMLLRYQLVRLDGTEMVLKEILYVSQTRCDITG
jgi:hypothetical protein